jgi:mitogen-activated protein kinase kinase
VEGDPPDLPSEGYSAAARDFVKSCLNKDPKKRPTYTRLLGLPWMASMSKIETIAEESDEDDSDDLDGAADAVSRLNLNSGTVDEEVAAWAREVIRSKREGLEKTATPKPALHAARLDQMSPISSPSIDSQPAME